MQGETSMHVATCAHARAHMNHACATRPPAPAPASSPCQNNHTRAPPTFRSSLTSFWSVSSCKCRFQSMLAYVSFRGASSRALFLAPPAQHSARAWQLCPHERRPTAGQGKLRAGPAQRAPHRSTTGALAEAPRPGWWPGTLACPCSPRAHPDSCTPLALGHAFRAHTSNRSACTLTPHLWCAHQACSPGPAWPA